MQPEVGAQLIDSPPMPPMARPVASRRGLGSYWRSERVYFSGEEYFAALLDELAKAKRTIDIETYIYNDDALGARFASALAAAAARGVAVRLLVDGVGGGAWVGRHGSALLAPRLALRVYHPLPWLLFSRGSSRRSSAARAFRLLMLINRRNHRKVCLIDRRVAWVGSLNIHADHSEELSGADAWRDTGARVEGPAVIELHKAFEYTWRRSWRLDKRQIKPAFVWRSRRDWVSSGLVRLNNKLHLRRRMFDDLIRRIAAARQRVWITNAYFVPNARLVAALGAAAHKGVDVRILVPSKSDHVFMPWVSSAFYCALFSQGVRIFEYQPRVLHAKTTLIDDWASVGSSNLNYRSLLHDLEADVVLLHPRTHRALERAFTSDLEAAKEIVEHDWLCRPWMQKWLGRMALRLRYWL